MNLVKNQLFEVNNELKIGHMRGDFVDKRMATQWIPTPRLDSKSEKELSNIQNVINEIIKKYNTFQKIVDECDNHYGKEIDYLFDGLNCTVDLFYSSDESNYWIRLIPQKGERNIYIYVYDK